MFSSSSDSEEELTINEGYAEKYNTWRQKEEIQKLKDRHGDVPTDTSESSSESEDENAEALTKDLEKGWLETLAALKSKDPKIYDQNIKFYQNRAESTESNPESKKEKKEKPIFLKDYERKLILEKEGKLVDEENSDNDNNVDSTPKTAGYYEEQEQIKKSFNIALESDSDDEDLFCKKEKSKEEELKEDEDYIDWMKGRKEPSVAEAHSNLEPLRSYWQDPDLDDGEKYLRDFFLNKRYLEEDDRIPSYHEVVNDDEDISEEERQLEKEETFEKKYNFRFEEPDPEFIKSYPRTIGGSVRRVDDKRSIKRLDVKNRKDQAKLKQKEELKQLKNLKKKEIQDKINKLKQITGNDEIGFSNIDINADFDPEEYDKRMNAIFNEDYYAAEEDDVKPVFADDEGLDLPDVQWDDEHGYQEEDENWEDTDFNMDAEYDPNTDPGPKKKLSKKERRLLKKQKKNKNAINETPSTQETAAEELIDESTVDAAFEEYYKLDYEDMIDDLPCRFKYRQVLANDFGLKVDEILKCPERELNMWVSVKKMSQYRTEEEELWDVRKYKKKSSKKENVLTSLARNQTEVLPKSHSETNDENSINSELITNGCIIETNVISPDSNIVELSVESGTNNSSQISSNDNDLCNDSTKSNNILSNTSINLSSVKIKSNKILSKNKNPVKKKKKSIINKSSAKNITEFSEISSPPVNKKQKTMSISPDLPLSNTSDASKCGIPKKSSKKKKKVNPMSQISDERLKAYGFDPKKIKYTPTWQKQNEMNK